MLRKSLIRLSSKFGCRVTNPTTDPSFLVWDPLLYLWFCSIFLLLFILRSTFFFLFLLDVESISTANLFPWVVLYEVIGVIVLGFPLNLIFFYLLHESLFRHFLFSLILLNAAYEVINHTAGPISLLHVLTVTIILHVILFTFYSSFYTQICLFPFY